MKALLYEDAKAMQRAHKEYVSFSLVQGLSGHIPTYPAGHGFSACFKEY
jgi:hypothetical protein